MNVFSSLDLIKSHRWSRGFFTTYALSLAFFEAVVLDAFVREQIGSTLILADIEGVRAALSEYGARSAGRLYEIEPVSVEHGCFHPKMMALLSDTEAHVVVGSGNLTFGGWGSNLECVEHLHTGYAADAIEDVADFLDSLATSPRVKHAAVKATSSLAQQLREKAGNGVRTGRIRVVHSLERALLDQINDIINDLGGANRLSVISPYFDASAVSELCQRFGVGRANVHAHPAGAVAGSAGLHWPVHNEASVTAVAVDWCAENDARLLHAKLFEIVCNKGRIALSGSANATIAAWGEARNVELCVARIERAPVNLWQLSPALPLQSLLVTPATDSETRELAGVLRATLSSGQVDGWILTRFPAGSATVSRLTAAGETAITTVVVGDNGRFSFNARDLERQAWRMERLILRLTSSSGTVAQGFVSFTDLAEIRRRLGPISASFFSFLAGSETPDDVAALMGWFIDHPSSLTRTGDFGGGGSSKPEPPDTTVEVATLLHPSLVAASFGLIGKGATGPAWHHFMQNVLQCFREPRGPIETAAGNAGNTGPEEPEDNLGDSAEEPTYDTERPLRYFEQLFDQMVNAPDSRRDLTLAFRITQYVCDRLEPESRQVARYLNRLIEHLAQRPPAAEDAETASAGVLVWAAQLNEQSDESLARIARGKLLRVGADVDGQTPDMTLAYGFARLLAPEIDFSNLWDRVRSIRTPQEEVRALRTGARPLVESNYPFLSTTPEWEEIKTARPSRIRIMREFSDICPFCYQALAAVDASRLRESGVVIHHGKILLCEEA